MKKLIKERTLSFISTIYALLNMLMFIAMRINYAGISKALGADKNQSFFVMYLPVIVLILMILVFVFSLVNFLFLKKKRLWPIITIYSLELVFSVAIIYIIDNGSFDYLSFILPHFVRSILISLILILFAILIFDPIKNTKRGIIAKISIMVIVITSTIFIGYSIKGNYFTYDAVVYAVNDKYQIVFSTNDESLAWVQIGNDDRNRYYDLYAGSMRSKDNVHKIEVPQSELDNNSYTICAEHILYRGPFGAYKGKTIKITHEKFEGVPENNFKYYSISDVHESFSGVINAASKQDFNFLVMVGDMSSMVEDEYFANYSNKIASAITKGNKPVVYARGNHEVKGLYAEDLYKYVGSENQNFYYRFSLANNKIRGVVLDIGEDHDDDWWEYYGSAQFDQYRSDQTAFLNKVKEDKYLEGDNYSMVVCHIPIPFINNRSNHLDIKYEWTDIINDLEIDVALHGHQHSLCFFDPSRDELKTVIKGSIDDRVKIARPNYWPDSPGTNYGEARLTGFNFNAFMVGKASNKCLGETEPIGTKEYTGLLTVVDVSNNSQVFKYTNALGNIVDYYEMFKLKSEQDKAPVQKIELTLRNK